MHVEEKAEVTSHLKEKAVIVLLLPRLVIIKVRIFLCRISSTEIELRKSNYMSLDNVPSLSLCFD